MRILICSFTFSPQANGVAEVVREQATGLAACNHEVVVATGFDPRRATAEILSGVNVREFNIDADTRAATPATGEISAYQDFVAKTDVDVILCHCWTAWPTDLAIPVLPQNRARKVLVSHGFAGHHWHRQRRFPWGLGQWLRQQPYVWRLPQKMRTFDHIVFLSERVDRGRFFDHWLLNRFGGPDWSVIPNGTWPERFATGPMEFRKRHGLGDVFLVLNVGLYTATKGQECALRAFSESGIAGSVLVFIGNEINDYARKLKQLAARLPFGHGSSVRFLERQDRESIRAAYQAADLFLMTSKGETQPLVLLDAMACGRPFVSTDVGCVSEFPGGLTVSHPTEIVGALRALREDPTRLAALGKLGLAAARTTYHWPRIVTAYDQLVCSLKGANTPIQA